MTYKTAGRMLAQEISTEVAALFDHTHRAHKRLDAIIHTNESDTSSTEHKNALSLPSVTFTKTASLKQNQF